MNNDRKEIIELLRATKRPGIENVITWLDSLVLGAFGCGVFRLKPELVAAFFKQVLQEDEFRGKFHTVVFALLEGKATPRKKVEEEGDFAPFYKQFGRFN